MTADFPSDYVIVAGSHDSENEDGLFPPYNFLGLDKGSHEEEEVDRSHVVALSYSNCLRYFDAFIFNFDDAYAVRVEGSDCGDKFWRGTVSFENAEEKIVVGCVISLDEVDKTHVPSKIVIASYV